MTTPAVNRPADAATKIPRATYRVQLHRDFRFVHATALVPYLARLGVSHLYCSPILRARAGSLHGYDIVDHDSLNPEIGDRADFDRLVQTLHDHGMGLIVDIVPNHMGVGGGDNAWWLDVLENGRSSAHAEFFDIDWESADPALYGRVLLPILGDQYGIVLERGELKLAFDAQRGYFTIEYYEHRLPVDPAGYADLLRLALRAMRANAAPARTVTELIALADRFARLPPHGEQDSARRALRQREKTALKQRLAQLVAAQPALAQALADTVTRYNGTVGERRSFDALDALIAAQPYRLAQWRVAADEINYRRFFEINELAGLRMERPEVFEATHRFILSLVAEGAIDGLRIDHPDGLADPAGYFERLQSAYAAAGRSAQRRPLYVVIEKIAAAHEYLPADWAVHGTTGYRFANIVNGLMIDGDARQRLDRVWRAFARDEAEDFDELAWRCKHVVMAGTLAGQLTVLANELLRLARDDRRTRDFTLNSLRRALADVVAAFPVYRTYVIDKVSAQDRRFIDWAIGRARRRSLAADASVFDFLRRVLLARPLPGATAKLSGRYRAFANRLQQYTAPVAAKGIEDTAFYRHQRLISVNEVGGEPDQFGFSVNAFHAASRDRAQHWPHTMIATSTHDTKRSEDVRARIDVISERPAAWRLTVRRWARLNRRHKRTVDGQPAPSRNDEYLLYQTLVGSLPDGTLDDEGLAAYAARIEATMLKSVRESKLVTSWISPNTAYETALTGFVRALLERRDSNLFLADLEANAPVFAWFGSLNALTIAALKSLSPGVPDFYQGQETTELSLVDPDNRRPVDYQRRIVMLSRAEDIARLADRRAALRRLLEGVTNGMAKFWTVHCALQVRRRHEAMLRDAPYLPLELRGGQARHGIAFARCIGSAVVIVVATRLHASLAPEVGELPVGAVWGDTELVWPDGGAPGGHAALTDAISGRRIELGSASLRLTELLADFPVAMLTS
ncbi:MAG TPA: malto-oligosyltrehalose synthase [Burkholderiaceae bacterium]|nr:malto-oligosyltrehalose synthase [Burkholderiaceae bacterium]